MPVDDVTIRRVELADALEMARLAGELGYPMSPVEMERTLDRLSTSSRHYVVVASDAARHLLGWMHVEHRTSIEGGERSELIALVVDPSARRRGIGRKLVGMAEKWTVAKGLSELAVRSNTERDISHPFYEMLGYARTKTQYVYVKALNSGSE